MTVTASRSRWADIGGPVHYLDFGGPAGGPVLVCVHGLGGAAVNWSAIAPLLTGGCHLLAPDLAGHGLTRSLGRGTDVPSNRALLHRFLQLAVARPAILMGNSMGGMISLLEASAAPASVAGLILLDPALPLLPVRVDPLVTAMFAGYITPLAGRWLASQRGRLPAETLVSGTLALCCADPGRVPARVVAEHIAVARQRAAFGDDGTDFIRAARSVVATAGMGYRRGRAYRQGIRAVSCPVLLLHGDRDRLVPVAAARHAARASPAWSLTVLPGVGHVPQLEAPAETAKAITAWLAGAGQPAAAAAMPPPAAEAGSPQPG